eukprot:TCONS_00001385-protein
MANKRKQKTSAEMKSIASKIIKIDERKEKLVPFDFDDNDYDVIIITRENEVYLPSGFVKMLSNGKDIQLRDGRMNIDASTECLVRCLSFYDLRFWDETQVFENLRDVLSVTKMLKMKGLRDHIENEEFLPLIRAPSVSIHLTDSLLAHLGIAHEFGLHCFVQKIMVRNVPLRNFNLIKSPSFNRLHRDLRFEILKNTINDQFSDSSHFNHELLEIQIIFNFFDFIVFENRSLNVAPQKSYVVSPAINTSWNSFEETVARRFIPYDKDLTDSVTLIVENKEIYVNSYLLTTNSPVFKAMLNSVSFKEGQSKRVELPGKKHSEILFFLHHLQTPQDIGNIIDFPDITILAPLCREYQVDWLTKKIKDFIRVRAARLNKKGSKIVALNYLSFSEEIGFDESNDTLLVNSLSCGFHSLQTCLEFSVLSRHKQVLIARKRLWLLLRHFFDKYRDLILNEEGFGFLSLFEEQTVFDFQYNKTECAYIKEFQEKHGKGE